MSKQPPPPQADPLSGVDIGKVMSSVGPIVKCVLLRCSSSDPSSSTTTNDDEKKMPAATCTDNNSTNEKKTPEVSTMSIKQIKAELKLLYNINGNNYVEKEELVKALVEARDSAANSNTEEKQSAKMNANDNSNTNAVNEEGNTEVNGQDDDDEDNEEEETEQAKNRRLSTQHLISEITIDTTPKKSMVQQVLGGPFTFLGQYEDEGIMVMIRRPDWELISDDSDNSADGKEGGDDEEEDDNNTNGADGLPRHGCTIKQIPPINPHLLQPPLDRVEVRGDIVLMRVAETEEELDNVNVGGGKDYEKESMDANDEAAGEAGKKKVHVPTNDEFFLDYTKEEYLKFASRTDIVAPEVDSSDEEGEEEEDESIDGENGARATLADGDDGEDDENDEDFDPLAGGSDDEEDMDEEEAAVGMMNMILSHMLRKFREENGRGPDSLELLEMRKALADKLGVAVPPVDEESHLVTSPSSSGSKDKKKVVVDEEKNETSPIPAREEKEDGSDDDDEEGEVDLASLKRSARELQDEKKEEEEGQSTKKARVNGGDKIGGDDK